MSLDLLHLTQLWEKARAAFLLKVLTRHGADDARLLVSTSRDAYDSALRQFYGGQDDLMRVGFNPPRYWSVTPSDAAAYKKAMIYAGKAPGTVNARLAALHSFYTYVQNTYRLPPLDLLQPFVAPRLLHPDPDDGGRLALLDPNRKNPFCSSKVERIRVDAYARASYPTRSETTAILEAIDLTTINGLRDYALLHTLLVTTRRIGEVRKMRWKDIRKLDNGQRIFEYIGKGRRRGRALLNPTVWQAIEAYLRAAGRLDRMGDGHYIFLGHESGGDSHRYTCTPYKALSHSACADILKKYGLKAGVSGRGLHLHGLRHRGLRNRKEDMIVHKGVVDLLALRDIAGHRSSGTTEIYLANTEDAVTDRWGQFAEAHARQLPEIPEVSL